MIKKILNTSGLVTTTALKTKITEVENKISNTSSLVTNTVLNTEISEIENKIPDNSKYIITQEFNKLTEENFDVRLKQADLVSEIDFDDKLTSFNKQIISNKIKHLEIQKKLNTLISKNYKFFLGRTYFAGNDRSQNTLVCQPTPDTLEIKKQRH